MDDMLLFGTRAEFRCWLSENSRKSGGIRLIFGKADSVITLSAEEALEEALCFGWIDGKITGIDETRYMKYFAPRRKNSRWSDKNRKTVGRLIDLGLMTKAGLEAVEAAKSEGTWDAGVKEPDFGTLIEAFAALLTEDPTAYGNFMKSPLSHKKRLVGFYYDAKQEATKAKRLGKILDALRKDERGMLY